MQTLPLNAAPGKDITPTPAYIDHLFNKLRRLSWIETATDELHGVFTPGYTQSENTVINVVLAEAAKLDMQCFTDLAGNIYMIYPGLDHTSTLVTGSHLDAVKNGGQYDGRAGVVAPMVVLKALHDAGVQPAQDICVMICRNEESAFYGKAYLGSTLATTSNIAGLDKVLALMFDDPLAAPGAAKQTLEEKMRELGLFPNTLRSVVRNNQTLFPLEQTAAFIELHIEQGPVLNQLKAAGQTGIIGLVDAIRGNVRFNDTDANHNVIFGAAGHSGAVPMQFRSDSVMAAVEFLSAISVEVEKLHGQGQDVTFTISYLHGGDKATPTTIAERCQMKFEFRSKDAEVLAQLPTIVEAARQRTTSKHGVELTTAAAVHTAPATMDAALRATFAQYAQSLNIPAHTLSSGAGHDVANFANKGVKAGLIFIEQANGSHHPGEDMDAQSFANACRVLAQVFLDGALVKQCSSGNSGEVSPFVEALQNRGALSVSRLQ